MSLDTATPTSGTPGAPARQPSPSAVTKADIAKALATPAMASVRIEATGTEQAA